MDKEPSSGLVWVMGLCGLIACLIAAIYKPKLLLIVIPLPAFFFYGLIAEIRDPYVGPGILREAGQFYINSAYGFTVLLLISILVGLGWHY
ncbi:MAG: hypothetical protein GWO07_01345 [Candidatus Dadabacteria bacterium]|nr:hypothetical protein [Candidatus Dadabacteria bacterium]NIS07419.1 hypothetical protein [Candidatus Dadabacteria bacterium]NIV41609.1 hypothetical protein [Candidatus Dadabacteria bacterium]NIX14612.1 hypothetical protein [Candidatus Dadabacteria bacterium]NIY21075.1 hypothetical protein [Candidatus Dadabacteria bacterium]